MTPKQFKQIRKSIISKKTGKPLTQRELASLLGMAINGNQYIRMIEKGKKEPSGILIRCLELVVKIQAILNVVDNCPELNLANYDESEVEQVNNAMIEIHRLLLDNDNVLQNNT